MGLNAIVYKRFSTLPADLRAHGVILEDAASGELQFPDGPGHPRELLFAADERLGNIALIDWLRSEIEARGPDCRVLLEVFLYSGSHTGDWVPKSRLNELEQEISHLAALPHSTPDYMTGFVESVRRLIVAAKAEQNPIVFT